MTCLAPGDAHHVLDGADLRASEQARTARLRRKLLFRIERRFQTRTQLTSIGALRFSFTRIEDPDRVLDEVADAEDRRERRTGQRTPSDQLHLPYWAELWDSAAGIGQFLCRAESIHRFASNAPHISSEILDLGCGMGLSGTVAAALGARVTFADLEPAALLFARLNSLPWRRRIATRQLDWRTGAIGRRFDLIIGADILYERLQWDFLEPFWRAHLSARGAVVLGEPGRQTGENFMPWIQDRGWTLKQTEEKVPTRERPIRLFVLTLSGSCSPSRS